MEDDEITHWLELPAGMGFVPFSELAHLIAKARFPVAPEDKEFDSAYGGARVNLDEELPKAVAAGLLKVRDPLTHGPHTFPHGFALQSAVVKASDLRAYLADRGMGVRVIAPMPAVAAEAPPVNGAPSEAPGWKDQARGEARRIRKERAALGRFPSLDDLGDEVARLFRERGITGPNGHALTDAYIKRHALQGHGITADTDRLKATLNTRGK